VKNKKPSKPFKKRKI